LTTESITKGNCVGLGIVFAGPTDYWHIRFLSAHVTASPQMEGSIQPRKDKGELIMRTLATLATLLVGLAFVSDTKKMLLSTFVAGTLFVFGIVLFLASITQAHAGHSRKEQVIMTHPAKPSSSNVLRDLGHIPPAVPLLLAAQPQPTPYDRLACRLACEQIGIWDVEQEVTRRLVNTCKIGCDLGQDHCR
jgi:hypothetical protein